MGNDRAWHRLNNETKKRYESGDSVALLSALYVCADSGLPLPDWVASNLKIALYDWFIGSKNLEEALNINVSAVKKNSKARKRKQQQEIFWSVWAWSVDYKPQTKKKKASQNKPTPRRQRSIPGGEKGEDFWSDMGKNVSPAVSGITAERYCIAHHVWLKESGIVMKLKGLNTILASNSRGNSIKKRSP